jgi:hypothetical protein
MPRIGTEVEQTMNLSFHIPYSSLKIVLLFGAIRSTQRWTNAKTIDFNYLKGYEGTLMKA